MRNILLFSVSLLVVTVISCKKDDNKKTSVDLITSTTWKIDTMGLDLDGNGQMDTELPIPLGDCDKDNTLTFSSDSTGIFSEEAIKCSVNDPQTIPFEWYFKSNDKVMNITGDLDELQGDIDVLELTENSLILAKKVEIPFSPTTTKLIVKLKK